jgi:hypothetical protein
MQHTLLRQAGSVCTPSLHREQRPAPGRAALQQSSCSANSSTKGSTTTKDTTCQQQLVPQEGRWGSPSLAPAVTPEGSTAGPPPWPRMAPAKPAVVAQVWLCIIPDSTAWFACTQLPAAAAVSGGRSMTAAAAARHMAPRWTEVPCSATDAAFDLPCAVRLAAATPC